MSENRQLSTIPYIITEREVGEEQIQINRSEHAISLYEDSVVTSSAEYALSNVWDVSCKSFSGEVRLFYLHTNQGVFTFEIRCDPDPFINAFRQVKGRP